MSDHNFQQVDRILFVQMNEYRQSVLNYHSRGEFLSI